MFVIVDGGRNTGSQLSKFLLDAVHTVRVIDERPDILEKLVQESPEGIIIQGKMILPRGTTVLEAGDEVLAMVDDNARQVLARLLGRPDRS
jgi:Trk K+ transport system NAD-binding subunit